LVELQLQAEVSLPKISLDRIVARLRRIQISMAIEDDEGLKEFLGLSM
jgi:hypothetical protein